MGQRLHLSQDWLRLRYIKQNKTIAEMAKEAMVTEMTIRRALESSGLINRL